MKLMIHQIHYHESVTQNSSSLDLANLNKCVLRRVLTFTKVSDWRMAKETHHGDTKETHQGDTPR